MGFWRNVEWPCPRCDRRMLVRDILATCVRCTWCDWTRNADDVEKLYRGADSDEDRERLLRLHNQIRGIT